MPSDADFNFQASTTRAMGSRAIVYFTYDILVGEFSHIDGNRYVMLVNKDVKNSHYLPSEWTTQPKMCSSSRTKAAE